MKTKFYSGLIAFLMLILVTGLAAEAQTGAGNPGNRHKKQEKGYKKEYKEERKESKREDKKDFRQGSTAYQYEGRDHAPYRHYDYDRHGNGKKTYRRYEDHHGYDGRIYSYHHPRYGTVYRSFNSVPVRLRCHDGYYYFHGGYYYRLYPEVGYVRVEIPRTVVFYEIPSHAVRVRIGGRPYYRYGELVFERFDRGYRLAPPSVMININL